MHQEAEIALYRMLGEVGIDRYAEYDVLDVGGRQVNESIRHLLPVSRWTGVDVRPGPNVDVVADARTWEPPRRFDVVFCTEVFEHVESWAQVLFTCARATKIDGGYLFVTCASSGRPPHGAEGTEAVPDGEYYRNVLVGDLASELRRYFRDVDVRYVFPPGDLYAWATCRVFTYDAPQPPISVDIDDVRG